MDPPGALKLAADIWQYPRKANRNTHTKTHKNRIQIQISREGWQSPITRPTQSKTKSVERVANRLFQKPNKT